MFTWYSWAAYPLNGCHLLKAWVHCGVVLAMEGRGAMRMGLAVLVATLLALTIGACKSGPKMQFVACQKGKDCAKCQGQGTSRCVKCLGRGRLDCAAGCFRGQINCVTCSGSGKNPFDSTGKLKCTGCNATGKANCWSCNGTGQKSCDGCGGDGLSDCGTWVQVSKKGKEPSE